MKNKKVLIYLAIAVVVLIIIAAIGNKQGWFGNSKKLKISTEKVQKRTIVETITANGKIQPETEIPISPDVSGEIVELKVKEGDLVKRGDLLLKINPDIYMSNLDRMKAGLNSSKSSLENSKARLVQVEAQFKQSELNYNRNKKLREQGAISQAEFENIEASYETAKAEVEATKQTIKSMEFSVKSSEAALKEATDNLNKTSIYSPIDGTISKLNVEKGQRVVGTAQMPGTELLRIANLNLMEVKVEVNENDIVRVNIGDTALIEVDAYLNKKFKGMVTEIANSANVLGTTTDQVTSFDVKILILAESYKELIPKDNQNYSPFRPGMSATVDIQTETVNTVLTVPIQAVTTRTDSTKKIASNVKKPADDDTDFENRDEVYKQDKHRADSLSEVVFIFKDGKVFQRKVKTGIQDSNHIQILEGLTENDEIVTAPYSAVSKKLKDSLDVEKVEKGKLFEEK